MRLFCAVPELPTANLYECLSNLSNGGGKGGLELYDDLLREMWEMTTDFSPFSLVLRNNHSRSSRTILLGHYKD